MSNCSIIKNASGEVEKVYAPNGKESILYNELLRLGATKDQAIRAWAIPYTGKFKVLHGDWEVTVVNIPLDENGEPTVESVLALKPELMKGLRLSADYGPYNMGTRKDKKYDTVQKVKRYIENINNKFPQFTLELVPHPTDRTLATYRVVPTMKSLPAVVKESKEQAEQSKRNIDSLMAYLLPKFPGLTYEWVKESDLNQNEHVHDIDTVRAFVRNNKIYLVEGKVTRDDALEELMHVFVEMLRQSRPNLFKGLFDQAIKHPMYAPFYELARTVYGKEYKDNPEERDRVIKSEVLAKVLTRGFNEEMKVNEKGRPESTFGKLIQRFLDWLEALFDMGGIKPTQTISEVVSYINTQGIIIPLPTGEYMYYSIDDSNVNPNSDINPDDPDDVNKIIDAKTAAKKTTRELNIERISSGIEKLKQIKKTLSARSLMEAGPTIDIFIKNGEDAIKALENGEDFISVTKYKGSYDSEESKSKLTQISINFGEFEHFLQDEIILESLLSKESPSIVFSREGFFEDFLKRHEQYLLFTSYDKQTLKNIGTRLAAILDELTAEGKVVLPEISICVKDVDGKLVIGRADVLSIDSKGVVEIADLKTKSAPGQPTSFFPKGLFTRPYTFTGDYKEGVAPEFEALRAMSKLNEYHLQLAIYSEMIKKMGIQVNEKGNQIFAITYNTDYDGDAKTSNRFDLVGFQIRKFNYGDMQSDERKYDNINRSAEDRFNPKPFEVQEEKIKEVANNAFASLSDDAKNKIISSLLKLAKDQITNLEKEKNKIDQNENLSVDEKNSIKAKLDKRISSITGIKSKLSDFTGETEEAIAFSKAMTIKLALDVFQNEIKNVSKRMEQLDIPSTYELNNIKHNNVLKEIQNISQSLQSMRNYLELFDSTVNAMEAYIDENALPEEKTEAKNAFNKAKREISDYLTPLIKDIDQINNEYIKIGKKVMKTVILQTIGVQRFEKVFGEMRKVLRPKLNWINKTIDRIESGEESAYSATFKLGNLVGKLVNNFFSTNISNADRLQMLKQEKAEIERLMEVNTLDENTLDDYLDGLVNGSESTFYLGSTISGNNAIISADSIIGSNQNSEMAINAMFQFMRNAIEEGKSEARDWAYSTEVDKVMNEFVNAMGGSDAANKAISEEVTRHKSFDENGNPIEEKIHRQYLDPVHQSFYNTYDSFKSRLKNLNKQIYDLTTQITEAANPAARQLLVNERKELNNKAEALNIAFTEFLIENTETRVKPAVMRLMFASGSYNEEITVLYQRMNDIISRAKGEEMLDEQDQEQIDEIEAQISRIRQKIRDENPDKNDEMTNLLDLFQFDLNYNLWTIKREDIIKQNDPVKLENFDRNNSDWAPTEEWWKLREDLFRQIAEITGKDPIITELYTRLRSIKKRNEVRGKFNFKYMSDTDIEEYNSVMQQLESRKDALKQSNNLSPEKQEELNELYSRLGNITKKEVSSTYRKEFEKRKNRVLNTYAIMKEAERTLNNAASPTKEMRENATTTRADYNKAEDEFAIFFNRNNNTKYELGKDIIGKKLPIKESPKSFLYEVMPISQKHMELVPNKKYRIRRLKAEAYNPNYQESFVKERQGQGMYPMPKGIRFNPATNTFDVDPKSKWANTAFLQMQGNEKAHDFYKLWVVENFLKKQESASGQPLGFNFPFEEQGLADNVISKGVEGFSREIKEKIQELSYQNSAYEKATNESGMTGQEKVRFKENTEMPADLTTTNGISAIVNWNYGYYANRALAIAGTEVNSILYFLDSIRKSLENQETPDKNERLAKIDVIIKQVEFERNKFIYGQLQEKEKNPHKIFNRKTLRTMMQLGSFGRMAFDIPMQFGNLLSGNVQAFLSTCSTRHADQGDYLRAKALVYGRWLVKMMGDWGKISDVSLETMIYREINPNAKDESRELAGASTSRGRKALNRATDFYKISTILQDKGETEIGLTTMLMIMLAKRYEVFETDAQGNIIIENGIKKVKKDADGNTVYVNGIDAFAKNGGRLALREDVNISWTDVKQLKGTIQTEVYRFQGNYSNYTKSKFGGTLAGSLYEFYRKYLIPAVSTRFSIGGYKGIGSAYSWDSEEAYMGWYVAVGKMYKYYGWGQATKAILYDTLLPGFAKKSIKLSDEMMTEDAEYYRSRSAMAGRELLLAFAFWQMYNLLRSMLYESDEDDLSYAELMLMRSLVKVSNESRSMVPMLVIGKPGDYIDNFGQFTSAFREGKTVWDLGKHAFWYADYNITGTDFAYERGFYQKDTPRFEAGDAKVMKNLSDLFGYSNIMDVYDPYEAAKAALKSKE